MVKMCYTYNRGMKKKRLTIELENENDIKTVNEFKGKCYSLGLNMKEKLLDLIKEFLKK